MRTSPNPASATIRTLLRIPLLASLTVLLFILAGEHRSTRVHAGITISNESNRNLYVLSIGINDYPEQSNVPRLLFAVPDARSVAAAFSTKDVRRTFNQVEVTTLVDSQATVAGVRSALEHLIQIAKPEDVVVLYYAGEGVRPEAVPNQASGQQSAPDFSFVVYDSTTDKNDLRNAKNVFPARELSLLLLSIQAQRQMIILDTCYSSLAFDSLNAALSSDSVFTLHDTGRKFALFGTAGEAAEFPTLGHGLLTYSLLRAMGGEADSARKGFITEADLEAYMMSHISYNSIEAGKPAQYLFNEQLLSYSDLRGMCLAAAEGVQGCDANYGYDPRASTQATRGFKTPQPTPAQTALAHGTDYAVILAGDSYDHWKKLDNPIYDAQTLQQELVQNYGYKQENIFYRQNPSKKDIHELLASLEHRTFAKNDRLLVYVAGHGYMEDSGEGFLVTRETLLPPEDPYLDTGLDLSRFRSMVDQLPIPHVLIVLDVCYGGSFKERKSIPAYTSENLDSTQPVDVLIANKMQHVSRLYIASGGLREAFDGEPGRHSPFARAFLKTLRQYGGPEHIVDVGSLDGKVQGLCPHPYFGPFGTHEDGGDFIFIPNASPHPVADPGLDAKVEGPHCSS